MTKEEILRLNPSFKFGDTLLRDYFIITSGDTFCCIRSGLRNGEDEIKSPYHYEDCVVGNNAEKIAVDKFNKWWNNLKH